MAAPPPHSRRSPERCISLSSNRRARHPHPWHKQSPTRCRSACAHTCVADPCSHSPSLFGILLKLSQKIWSPNWKSPAEVPPYRTTNGASQTQHFTSQLRACSIHAAVPDFLIVGSQPLSFHPKQIFSGHLLADCFLPLTITSPVKNHWFWSLCFFVVFFLLLSPQLHATIKNKAKFPPLTTPGMQNRDTPTFQLTSSSTADIYLTTQKIPTDRQQFKTKWREVNTWTTLKTACTNFQVLSITSWQLHYISIYKNR